MAAIKVLFLGDAHGDLRGLIKKAEQVHKKNGPFSAAFCLGRLLDDHGSIINAGQPMPSPSFPIYLLGAGESCTISPPHSSPLFLFLSSPPTNANDNTGPSGTPPAFLEGVTNLHYLGKSGLARIADLNVVFLDGLHSSELASSSADAAASHQYCYTRADLEHLKAKIETMEGAAPR